MPAPKDKHPGGRPLTFKSEKVLRARIDEYFAYCDNRIKNIYSKEMGDNMPISYPEPYTMSGLAEYLDVDRKTIVNYSHKDQFFLTIKRARAKVEHDLEVRLLESRTPVGVIFNLKNNFAWIDESKQTIEADINSKNELSPEAAAILAKASRSNDGATESE
jgi:hypothetical protein